MMGEENGGQPALEETCAADLPSTNGGRDALDRKSQAAAGDAGRNETYNHHSDRHVLLSFVIIFSIVFVACIIFLHSAAYACRSWTFGGQMLSRSQDSKHVLADQDMPSHHDNANVGKAVKRDAWSEWHTLASLSAYQANSRNQTTITRADL